MSRRHLSIWHGEMVITALLTAFVSIELSPGTGALVGSAGSAADAVLARPAGANSQAPGGPGEHGTSEVQTRRTSDVATAAVGFEEKFQYRRPIYACLSYFHGKPCFDYQILVSLLGLSA
ncbi:unnamed protein product [Protopolystoma xenopodis]|uniref:Uncharacterized protein n=1 Tax=Protopolystoma xenopodis TaxID=117903 RepID=A0A448XPD6_9PLAT|nr:unnamed protein product [Protopolystoma xenopodis]